MSAISLVEHSGDGFRNCLFLDAVVDVEELACSLECVRSIQPRGLYLVGCLAETCYSL